MLFRTIVPALILVVSAGYGDSASGQSARPDSLPDFFALWDFDHPESTEAAFRAILPAARAASDIDYLAQLLTQIARTEGLQRRFADAHRTLDETEALLPRASATARVRYLLERGRAFNSSGHKDTARPLFDSAWDLARNERIDVLAVDAAHMIAIVCGPDSAIVWNEKAIAYAAQSQDPKARNWLASLENNLGWAYQDKGDYAKALELFRKALAGRQEQGRPGEIRIARWCIARCLRSLGRFDEALSAQEALRQEITASAAEPDGYVFEEIGECLLALGRLPEARPNFAKAYELLSQDPGMREDEAPRLARLKDMGSPPAAR
jgi:tetratricopeptide (TPR) repeat protein